MAYFDGRDVRDALALIHLAGFTNGPAPFKLRVHTRAAAVARAFAPLN